jgi:hypothetical protein
MISDEHSAVEADESIPPASASDPACSEDLALAWLKRGDLTAPNLEKLAKNPWLAKSRKIKLALIGHPRTPRHVSLSLLRHLYTFDLMAVALMPVVAADIKIAVEEALINRLETISTGEKMSLARRASARVVAALLGDSDMRVVNTALENSRLTEAMVAKSLVRHDSADSLAEAVRRNGKWSLRPEIQLALQRRADRVAANRPPEQTTDDREG